MASYYINDSCHDSWNIARRDFKSVFPKIDTDPQTGAMTSYNLISWTDSEPNISYTIQNGNTLLQISGVATLRTCPRPELLSEFSVTDISFLGTCVIDLALGFLVGQQR